MTDDRNGSRTPRSIYPITLERDYAARLKRRLRRASEKLGEEFREAAEIRGDSEATREKAAKRILKKVKWQYESTYDSEADKELTEEVAEKAEGYVERQLKRQHKQVTGVDPLPTRKLKRRAMEFSRDNVSLITSLEEEFFSRLEGDIVIALRDGARYEQLAEVIRERYGMSSRRAELIARDQMGSLVSKLNQEKQQQVGVEKYRWRNSQDERVVGNPGGKYPEPADPSMHGDHWAREGEIFSWSDEPEDGHPGVPINCRCTAEPVWEFDGEEFTESDTESIVARAENSELSSDEVNVVEKAARMLDEVDYLKFVDAPEPPGRPRRTNVSGRTIKYEPEVPASGMSLFGEEGFILGPEAYRSRQELRKTLLHEMHRLEFSDVTSEGADRELAAKETRNAKEFADKAYRLSFEDESVD